jgi:hypothetical protein
VTGPRQPRRRKDLEKPEATATEQCRDRAEAEPRQNRGKETRTGGRNVSPVKMTSQKASHRKSNGGEGGSLAPITLAQFFEEEEDTMEIDSLAQSLKRLLEEKAKNQNKGQLKGSVLENPSRA